MRGLRLALGLAGALAFGAAQAYVPPATAVLKRVSQKREEQALATLEVQGTVTFLGETAVRASALGVPLLGTEASTPAFLTVKVAGKCRLELALPDAAPGERPAVSQKGSRLQGVRGLERIPAAVAALQAVCALLGERPGGAEPERPWVQALSALGVSLDEVSLGRAGGRVAYVIGGKARDEKALAWVDKQGYQPLRLSATLGGARHEVRLLDWGSPTGGDLFPRALEVLAAGQPVLRLVTERVLGNPKVSDAIF